MTPEKIILDCDPGHDDALALMMAVASTQIKLLGVTTSAGNQTPDKTLNNALRMLTLLGTTDVPVAGGNHRPLMRNLKIADYVHGETGLDGADLPEPTFEPVDQPAVELIADILHSQIEPITLVVTGPMTNIALFLRIHPELKNKIKQIVFMGGAAGQGNVHPTTEFNMAVDPEAAKIVVNEGIPLVMAGLNVTLKAQICSDDLERMRKINNQVAQAITGQMEFYGKWYGQDEFGLAGTPVHDPCTIAYLLKPAIFETHTAYLDVETQGQLTAGETIVDFAGLMNRKPNAKVLMNLDRQRFVDLIIDLLHQFD
ncbi:pyrimidine-specific ribonucleoside hydrolase RihA [Ligilactobacillus araffinosus]|uniref:Ribonucleoside hydrolase 1 n=1 Tax=Ligilactobacillus araffinosus DSM 20653 TaxID=1423820 RepID=A0A0R1ZAU8_9LACO|nr:pyrimidine-specific ribonucleoside hydrolase RihA [Ligilactobacillus araffinosus]KRM52032.1 ribonucleoside hydrolase 1 [Ligilactobacillus araffinosus DSM 20653]